MLVIFSDFKKDEKVKDFIKDLANFCLNKN